MALCEVQPSHSRHGYGAFLVAFLALFVRMVGMQLWNLMCYLVFKIRSSPQGDALHFQQQLVLRNTTSNVMALRQFLKIGMAWHGRGTASKPLRRSLGYAFLALLNIAAFAAAGILSSWVTKTTSEVLLTPNSCGDYEFFGVYGYTKNSTPLTTAEYSNAYMFNQVFTKSLVLQGASYVKDCYGEGVQRGLCMPITRNAIDLNVTYTSECPFGDLCIGNSTMVMDTGLLDSLLDFGINSKPEDRIAWRKTIQCAPIATEGYRSDWLSPSDPLIQSLNLSRHPRADDQLLLYYYGASEGIPTLLEGNNASIGAVAHGEIKDPMTVNFTYLFSKSALNNANFTIIGSPEESTWIIE
jgi:hypothetical protein